MRIGIISDTHGLLRPEVLDVFRGVDHIVHAGDIGGEHVLRGLREIAPVTYVGGNNDEASEGYDIVRLSLGPLRILLTHILPGPDNPGPHVRESLKSAAADLVIFGHSHQPCHVVVGGIAFFNPGSAGPRRFRNPICVGMWEESSLSHVTLVV